MSEELSGPGSIQIEDIILSNADQTKQVSIKLLVKEFNIFESINKCFVTASFVLLDSVSLITVFPITGEELIHVKFKTPTSAFLKSIDKVFRVISVRDMVRTKVREEGYTLVCVSVPMVKDMTRKVRKAYSNMLISDMVKKIGEEFLGITEFESVEDTEGNRTIVIPNYSPSKAIEFLSREAKSPNSASSNYVFFENCDGFNFKTTDEIIQPSQVRRRNAGRSIDKYFASEFDFTREGSPRSNIMGGSGGGSQQSSKPFSFLRIMDFHFENIGNYHKGAQMGFVENSARFIDPLTSFYVENNYKYIDEHSSFKKTNQSKPGLFLSSKNDLTFQGESFVTLQPTNHQQNNEYSADQKILNLHYKIGASNIFENLIATVTIPGDSEKRVGQVIDLQFPEYGATDDIEGKVNKFISGEYIILAARHQYNHQGYVTVMTVAKNAYENDLDASVVAPKSTSLASEQ